MVPKVKVSRAIAEALDKQEKDNWSVQYNLITHCHSFSGNGICYRSKYSEEFQILNSLKPLEYARCLIEGYEINEE